MSMKFACAFILLAASLGAQSDASVRSQSAPVFSLPEWVLIQPNIPYGPYPETVLDILMPKSSAPLRRPGVLLIHGGGWVGGSKEAVVQKFALPFLEKGFVVANVEYRLAKAAPAPAAVQDVLLAAHWFRTNANRFNVDPRRIIACGDSAGGHLALMVGLTPKSAGFGPEAKVAAVINFYGIVDVEDQLQGPNLRQYAVTWVPEKPGRFDLARKVSPISYVRKDVPAVLTIHGTADDVVPYDHGIQITKSLRDAGADAEMISVSGAGHGFSPDEHAKIFEQIWAFLRKRGILK